MNYTTLLNTTEQFANKLTNALSELQIFSACLNLKIDHICVRLAETEAVFALKAELAEHGEIISAVEINGREISIIQLSETINLTPWETRAIELPFPKPSHSYTDGWEHVEFVIDGAENTIDGVRKKFFTLFPHLDKVTLTEKYQYSEDVPQSDTDQIPNPTVGITVNGIGVKFHAHPIQEVVGYVQ